jgi:hypothetical protein
MSLDGIYHCACKRWQTTISHTPEEAEKAWRQHCADTSTFGVGYGQPHREHKLIATKGEARPRQPGSRRDRATRAEAKLEAQAPLIRTPAQLQAADECVEALKTLHDFAHRGDHGEILPCADATKCVAGAALARLDRANQEAEERNSSLSASAP